MRPSDPFNFDDDRPMVRRTPDGERIEYPVWCDACGHWVPDDDGGDCENCGERIAADPTLPDNATPTVPDAECQAEESCPCCRVIPKAAKVPVIEENADA